MSSGQPYRALRIVLFVISAIEAVAGLVLVFATSSVLGFTPVNAALVNSGFMLTLLKAIGILALSLAYLLCAAARDPVRYIAIVDAFAFLLIASALLEVYALVALHVGSFLPGTYLIGRAIVQLALALVLIALRPKAGARVGSAVHA